MPDILLLSDTHLFSAEELPDSIFVDAPKCDLIVHCGDIVSSEIIEILSSVGEVKFVLGNCDYKSEFPGAAYSQTFMFAEKRIGVIHGAGMKGDTNRLLGAFEDDTPQVVLSGHTHKKRFVEKNGVYFINPGSISSPKDGSASYAIVSINGDKVEARFFENPE